MVRWNENRLYITKESKSVVRMLCTNEVWCIYGPSPFFSSSDRSCMGLDMFICQNCLRVRKIVTVCAENSLIRASDCKNHVSDYKNWGTDYIIWVTDLSYFYALAEFQLWFNDVLGMVFDNYYGYGCWRWLLTMTMTSKRERMKEGFNLNYELWFLGTEVTEDTDATALYIKI